MKTCNLVALAITCLVTVLPSLARADEAAAQKVLEHWVGRWTGNVAGVPTTGPADTAATPASSEVAWTLGGKFLQGTNSDAAGKPVAVWLMRFDPAADKYKVWFFAADGTASEWKGTWSDADSTMTWSGEEAGSSAKLSGYTRFTGDKQEWKLDFEEDGKTTSHTGTLEKK